MPQADMALAVFGRIVVEQPSSRAIGMMLRPAAPPPATITLSRGLRPSLTVISWIALIISSLAMVMIAKAVSRGLRPISRASVSITRCAARGIERHAPAVEIVRIEIAEHDAGVGHRRLVAAAAVAGRPRHGAGALRADAQQAAGVDPGDRAAAGADRCARRPSTSPPCGRSSAARASCRACRPGCRRARGRRRRWCRRCRTRWRRRRASRSWCRPGRRPAPWRARISASAPGASRPPTTCWQPPAEVPISSSPAKPPARRSSSICRRCCCISGLSEASTAVVEARRYSRTIGISSMRQRVGNAGQLLVEDAGDRLLVGAVGDRPHQADRDRLELALLQRADHLARLRLVERRARRCPASRCARRSRTCSGAGCRAADSRSE